MSKNRYSILDYSKIIEITKNLIEWLDKLGYRGYDPYDIWENKLAIFATRYGSESITSGKIMMFARIPRGAFYYIDKIFPKTLRLLLSVNSQKNAKAFGLFASSYLNLYKSTKNKVYFLEAQKFLEWLVDNGNENYGGIGWGYPFNWQSKEFIPRFTPSSVVTSIIGLSFLKYWQISKEIWVKEIIEKIIEFFLYGLNIDNVSKDELCFSYTPLDYLHVHNANLFVAEFLIKSYNITKNDTELKSGYKALNYTLNKQNLDGSFSYSENTVNKIDHYHTGFVILSLKGILNQTNDKRTQKALIKCFKHYLDELFYKGIPKFRPSTLYPVDIHSLAVAIITLIKMENFDPRVSYYLKQTIKFTIKEFRDTTGYFYYRIEKIGPIKWKVKFPYIRWAEAWMLLALSEYLLKYQSEDNYNSLRES